MTDTGGVSEVFTETPFGWNEQAQIVNPLKSAGKLPLTEFNYIRVQLLIIISFGFSKLN